MPYQGALQMTDDPEEPDEDIGSLTKACLGTNFCQKLPVTPAQSAALSTSWTPRLPLVYDAQMSLQAPAIKPPAQAITAEITATIPN